MSEPTAPRPGRVTSWTRFGVILVVVGAISWWVSGMRPEAPPRQVWDPAHGHYHTLSGAELPAGQPQGQPGQVWSDEHGHWHDAPQGTSPESP